MRITVMRPVTMVCDHIRINVPVRDEPEAGATPVPGYRPPIEADYPAGYTGKRYYRWEVCVGVDTGHVYDWPKGVGARVEMKVTDEGAYQLVAVDAELDCVTETVLAERRDHVPSCVPGDGGDYIEFDIGPDGVVKDWAKFCNLYTVRDSFFSTPEWA